MEHCTNLFHALVTHIVDPNNIWIRCGTDHDIQQYAAYQQDLDGFYSKNGHLFACDEDFLCRGASVVVADNVNIEMNDTDTTCHWRRAYVKQYLNEKRDTVDVFFIDLGYSEIVKRNQLRVFPQEFQTLPSQAVPVSLACIKPLAQSWTTRAKSFLEAKVLHKDILLSFVTHDETCGHDAVALYTKIPDGSWYSLIHEMAMEELARLTGKIPELLTEETANIALELMNKQQREQLMMQSIIEEEHQPSYEGREEMEERETALEQGRFHAGPPVKSEDGYLEDQVPPHVPSSLSHSQASSKIGQDEGPSSDEISHVDLGSLAERTSFSIAKLQQARQDELKRKTRAHIMASIDNDADDLVSVSEDQDWDAVRDIDTHDDIQSQIHKVLHRQSSDGELAQFAFELEQLSKGIIQSPVSHVPDQNSRKSEQKAVEENQTKKPEIEIVKKSSPTFNATHTSQDKEIEEYKVVKKIQEILSDPEKMGADVISAFIHSIVEPDVDISCEDLSTVLYALLDHAICKSDQEQEMVLGVLETYSDTNCFVQAMLDVLLRLKDEYVKQTQSVRLKGKHTEFAKMLALIFTYSNDWDQRSTRDIQEFISSFIHNWIVFNRSRHQTGEATFNTELMYLECAEVFLPWCFDILQEKFQETVSDLMSEMRHKLLHDSSPRWIREHLLDLMLNLNCSGGVIKETKRTENSATQTGRDTAIVRDSHNKDSDIKYSRDCEIYVTSNDPTEASMLSGKQNDDGTSHVSSSEQPYSIVESHSSVKQFICSKTSDSNAEQPVMEKDADSKRPLDRYSCQASGNRMISQKDSGYLIDQPSSKPSSSSPVPAECLSSSSQPKKRGVPKSIRNLPRLLGICQEGLPVHSSPNQQEVSAREQQNDSSLHSISVSSTDLCSGDQQSILEDKSESMGWASPLQIQESEGISLEIAKNSDTAPEISLVESSHGLVKESPNQEEDNVLQHSQLILSEEPRKHVSPKVPSADIEDSSALNSTVNDVSDIFQLQSDHQGGESDHQSEKRDRQSEEEGMDDTVESVIKYTTLQLREMNPDKFNSPLPLEELWEPQEILEKMIAQTRRQERNKLGFNYDSDSNKGTREISMTNYQQDQVEEKVKTRQSPSMAGDNKEVGSSYLPADYMDITKSQSPSFASEKVSDAEVDTYQNIYELPFAPNKMKNKSSGRNKSATKGGLKNIGEDFLFPAVTDINTETESESQPGADEGIEIWHENNNLKNTESKENISEGHSGKGKGKKKKLKYRPLEFFESTSPILNDGKGDAEIGIENLDEFSPEALRMYEDLEREEKEKEALIAAGGEILTFSKFGGGTVSVPKRPSLFAEARQRYQAPKVSKPWCPGKRKCTRCGSEEHTVYDCEDDGSSLYKC